MRLQYDCVIIFYLYQWLQIFREIVLKVSSSNISQIAVHQVIFLCAHNLRAKIGISYYPITT